MKRPAVRIILAPLRNRNKGLVTYGQTEGRTILIDASLRQNPAFILLHELLHVQHPSWSETKVRKETAKQWKAMTWKQKAKLLKMVASAIIEREEEE